MHHSPPEYVAHVVRYNTGNSQPEYLPEFRIKLIAVAHGRLSLPEFDEALATAAESGLLVKIGDGYAVPE